MCTSSFLLLFEWGDLFSIRSVLKSFAPSLKKIKMAHSHSRESERRRSRRRKHTIHIIRGFIIRFKFCVSLNLKKNLLTHILCTFWSYFYFSLTFNPSVEKWVFLNGLVIIWYCNPMQRSNLKTASWTDAPAPYVKNVKTSLIPNLNIVPQQHNYNGS